MQKKLRLGVLWILISSFFIFSCGCGGESNDTAKVFKYNHPGQILSTDPAFARDQSGVWIVNDLYNGLLQLDRNLQIAPSIAKSWQVQDEGKTYVFTLRNDVYFIDNQCFESSKGRLVTAQDFVYSFKRLMDKDLASPGAWIFNGKVDDNNAFEALNDSTFVLHLNKPFPPMLSILTMQYAFVVPKEAVEFYKDQFRANPVGTGPFKLKKWDEGTSMILVKNDNYFEKENGVQLPKIDGVKISFIENKKSEFLNFMQGNFDFMSGVDASIVNEIFDEQGNLLPNVSEKANLVKIPYLNTEYLGFNVETLQGTPYGKKEVRQAINYAIDRKQIVQYLRNNIGKTANAGMIPDGLASFNPVKVKGYAYDKEKSIELLANAGYPVGKGLPELTLYTNEKYKDIAELINKELNEIGIPVKIEITQAALLREWMAQGKATFFRGSWIADYPDGESYLSLFYGKNPSPPNYTHFENAKYDKLYEAALLENDVNKRIDLYHQMEQIVINEAAVVPLYYDEVVRLTQKNIKGLEPNAMNVLDLKYVEME